MLAVELAELLRCAVEREGGFRRQMDGFFVEDGQRAGQAEVDVVDERVRRRLAGIVVGAREQLRFSLELHVALDADGHFVLGAGLVANHG